jgi:preprotein translocase subunit SecY
MPEFLILKFNTPFYFGGTSLLIIVVVTMDFMTQVPITNDVLSI